MIQISIKCSLAWLSRVSSFASILPTVFTHLMRCFIASYAIRLPDFMERDWNIQLFCSSFRAFLTVLLISEISPLYSNLTKWFYCYLDVFREFCHEKQFHARWQIRDNIFSFKSFHFCLATQTKLKILTDSILSQIFDFLCHRQKCEKMNEIDLFAHLYYPVVYWSLKIVLCRQNSLNSQRKLSKCLDKGSFRRKSSHFHRSYRINSKYPQTRQMILISLHPRVEWIGGVCQIKWKLSL